MFQKLNGIVSIYLPTNVKECSSTILGYAGRAKEEHDSFVRNFDDTTVGVWDGACHIQEVHLALRGRVACLNVVS